MTATSLNRRAATPARVWVPSVALPAAAALALLVLMRQAEGDKIKGTLFAFALCFFMIACVIGPLVCWAWRTRDLEDRFQELEDRHQDDASDLLFRIRRLEADNAALSELHAHVAAGDVRVAVGLPAGPPRRHLYVVRDDSDTRRN